MAEDLIEDIWGQLDKDLKDDPNASLLAMSAVPHGIPTRQPQLDLSIGRDGIPIGRIIEFFGFERSGKTTSALHIAGEVQRRGGLVLFIDTENAFEMDRAVECGCTDGPTFKPGTAQSVDAIFRMIEKFLDSLEAKKWSRDALIIVDSVTAVENEFNLERDFGTTPRAAEDARTLRSGIRRVQPRLAELNVPCIFINHSIENPAALFGKKSKAAGGHAIKFAASLRVEYVSVGEVKDKEKVREGQKIKVSIEKLKGAPLIRTTYDTQLLNSEGFDFVGQLREAAMAIGLVTQTGQGRGTQYNIMDIASGDIVESLTKEGFKAWVEKHGREASYDWFLTNARIKGEITPWGQSRLPVVENAE
jgi:recombination protein RecA